MREMKYSGVDWIGKIPTEWSIKRVKLVLQERKESNNPVKTDYILSLTNDRGVIPYADKGDIGNKSKEDLTGYKLAYPGDIVLNSMNVIIGSVALSQYYGCVSPVYYTLFPRNKSECIRYYNYLFQTKELQNKLKGYGNGIMEIRMRIQMSKLNTVLLPIPPTEQQHRLADYLDEKCTKIDAIITHEQEVVEKLKAYKLSVITEAVKNDKWPIISLRHCILNIEQGWSPPAAEKVDDNYGWNVLSLSSVKNGVFDKFAVKPIDANANIPEQLELKNGDFLMTRSNTRELVGDICVVDSCDPNTIFSDLIYRITFNSSISPQYAKYVLLSLYVRQQIQETARGSSGTMPKISHKAIKELKIALPEACEQIKIIEMLDENCKKIESIIQKKCVLIDKLTDYKKSLIYEIVTGKKEV